jgi:hypothetical protein
MDIFIFKHNFYIIYRNYERNNPRAERRSADPKTPDRHSSLTSTDWNNRMDAWKSSLGRWNSGHQLSTTTLKTTTSLTDNDQTATFERAVNAKLGILKLPNGKKALVGQSRIWIWKQPLFGGWSPMAMPAYKVIYVNARSIPKTHGAEYQVTFCHSGMYTRDPRSKKFVYSKEMHDWIDKIVTLEALNSELNEFKLVKM